MALNSGREYYTEVTFTENGMSTTRRMHRLSVQAHDGQIHIFEKDRMPDRLVFDSGFSHKGDHLGTLLGLPREKVPTSLRGFVPGPRDWVYVIVGAALVVMLKAALILAASPY